MQSGIVLLAGGVALWNERTAQNQPFSCFIQRVQIGKQPLRRDAGKTSVLLRPRFLAIKEKQLDARRDCERIGLFAGAGGFHAHWNAVFMGRDASDSATSG